MNANSKNIECPDLGNALFGAFDWTSSKEGYEYWSNAYVDLGFELPLLKS